jgi:hypothetical protein
MTSFVQRNIVMFAVVSVLCVLSLWLWAVPGLLSRSTFAAVSVLLFGGLTISITTWRNAQSADSTAQLLYTTETTASTRGSAASVPRVTAASRDSRD